MMQCSIKTTFARVLGLATVANCLRPSFAVHKLEFDRQAPATANTIAATPAAPAAAAAAADTDPKLLYPAHNLAVPIDHFHNDSLYEPHTSDTFQLRYWFDASHYQPGGPVIVLQGGETSGVGRLRYLQKGILSILAQATGGLPVVLEHRYYGSSIPVLNFSVESLRFLTTDQALADMAYFAQNIKFPGLEHIDLTAPNTAYIAYGGSYAGALVAFLRKLYPDVYWGAIASSATTQAIYDYWAYNEATRLYSPREFVTTIQKFIHMVDNILIGKKDTEYVQRLKNFFGLGTLTYADDFGNALFLGPPQLQNTNWDPALNDTEFGRYCDTVASDALIYNDTESRKAEAVEILKAGGYGDQIDALKNRLLNYAGYINMTIVNECGASGNLDGCISYHDVEAYKLDDISRDGRLWPWQTCTEWGLFVTGSGVPEGQLPVVSRLVDLDFLTIECRDRFNITTPPKVERINQWGGFSISYPRLAFIDGEKDPWRQATPHAIGQPDRVSTTSEPFILIPNAVHHWDENGLFPNQTTADLPPASIKQVQAQQVAFVQAWLEEWKQAKDRTKQGVLDGEMEL